MLACTSIIFIMMTQVLDNKKIFLRLYRLCPVRHILFLLGLILIGGYHILKYDRELMASVCDTVTRPYHRLAGQIADCVPFSLAEILYAALVLYLLIYLPLQILRLIRRPEKGTRAYRLGMTLLSATAILYGGYCLLWGVFYAGADFQKEIGVEAQAISQDELYDVTSYFVQQANTYAALTQRDEKGCFSADPKSLFLRSENLYDEVCRIHPALSGPSLRAKPMIFSRFMSWINFTGFFFPFTGEANLNAEAPLCLLPSTIAHELAHQRGVAPEDEANFAAVIACMYSGDPDFCYSGALLALIHLSNALYDTDYDRWLELRQSYSEEVLADLQQNNEYWNQFETKAADISETVYEGFLATYGEQRGMQSYGACVDLLVAYYHDKIG